MNNTSVDSYLRDGCGRCEKYQTPDCKVHLWTDALVALRDILRASALTEEMKWGSPCYTLNGKNVVMLASFRDRCALSFFKGAALEDPGGALVSPGPNSRYGRLLEFRSAAEVEARRDQVARFIEQAIALERAGVKVQVSDEPDPLPAELEELLDGDPSLRDAFDALTPGRQRSYVIHVGGAKQSATRASRAERCIPKILAGKGFNER